MEQSALAGGMNGKPSRGRMERNDKKKKEMTHWLHDANVVEMLEITNEFRILEEYARHRC